jgi:hypothetical protein
MRVIFERLEEALQSEHLNELWPSYIGLGTGESRSLVVFDHFTETDRFIEIYRYPDGKYSRPVHRALR